MEAGAAIAGLLSLAGQCLDGAIKLRDFWKAVKDASSEVRRFLVELDCLIRTLHDAERLLDKSQDHVDQLVAAVGLDGLQLQLESGNRDVTEWLTIARRSRNNEGKGLRAWLSKTLTAANRESLRKVRHEMQQRRHALSTALSVFGRNMDLENLASHADTRFLIRRQADQLHRLIERLNKEHLEKCAALDEKLETLSQGSLGSFQSIQSTLSSVQESLQSTASSRVLSPGSESLELKLPHVAHNFLLAPLRLTASNSSVLEEGVGHTSTRHEDLHPRSSLSRENLQYYEVLPTSVAKIDEFSILLENNSGQLTSDWLDTRDRIDRWMLHNLMSSGRELEKQHEFLQQELAKRPEIHPELKENGNAWQHLVKLVWFADCPEPEFPQDQVYSIDDAMAKGRAKWTRRIFSGRDRGTDYDSSQNATGGSGHYSLSAGSNSDNFPHDPAFSQDHAQHIFSGAEEAVCEVPWNLEIY